MEELIRKSKKGDNEAFTELMLLVKDEIYRIAKIRLKNDEDIYDAIQETMILAFKSIKKLKEDKYFKTWIIKILINECNKIYRKKENIVSFENIEAENYIYSKNDNIEEKIYIKNLIEKLKYEEKLIIKLYYQEMYKDREIGRILNLKENTVRTKRTRAKEKLKIILDKEEKNG